MSLGTWILSILVGSGLGALLGATRSCKDGACPLTANPWRGALWGGLMGLMLAGSLTAGPGRGAQVQQPSVAKTAAPAAMTGAGSTASEATPLATAPASGVTVIGSNAEFEKMLASPGRSVLVLHADWCVPCHIYLPTFEKVAAGAEGKAAFYEVDVDRAPTVAKRLRVDGVPTTVIFENGREVARLLGGVGADELRKAAGA